MIRWEYLTLRAANDNKEPTPEEKAISRERRILGIVLPRLQDWSLKKTRRQDR